MTGNEALEKIIKEIKNVIIGKDEVIGQVLTAIISDGHILIDDIPGVGKTSLAVAVSKTMSLEYKRVQFTPDVLPSDVTGFSMYNKSKDVFEYKPGAVMTNLFLADEINRASSKTQSALLEAMEERCVTVDSKTYDLPEEFTVIATQNPVGSVGTHMLPESQVDRFMFSISMGYPSWMDEAQMLKMKTMEMDGLFKVKPIINLEGLKTIKAEVRKVFVHDEIYEYISKISDLSRKHKNIELGISPRGSIAIMKAARGCAYICGRNYVSPSDVNNVLFPCVNHRIILNGKLNNNKETIGNILNELTREAAR